MASSRIQRWALTLSAYCYQIAFKAGRRQGNVDTLSRLPLNEAPDDVPLPGDTVYMLEALDSSCPVTTAAIKSGTDKDPILSCVRNFVLHGNWDAAPKEPEFVPYRQREHELSVQNDCLLWGSRVVVLKSGREAVLTMLHDAHPGVTRMKALARGIVWWPGIDSDLEAKGHFWENSSSFWWTPTPSGWRLPHRAQQAVRFLRHVFSTHGIPDRLVSDNGTAFTSEEFKIFVKRNGIHHSTSAPYHPATNGLAERAVQTFKENLKKSCGDLETRFLFHYRTTPHTTTGVSPAELLLGRKPRTLLDNLHPDLSMNGSRSQEHQKIAHDKHSRHRLFQIGDTIYVKNCRNTPEWLPGVVSGFSELALLVKLLNGKICRRHIDHVRVRTDSDQQLLQEGSVVKCAEGGNAVCSEPGSAITENGTDLLSEDFVADLLVHSAPETRAVDPRVNNPNEAMQETQMDEQCRQTEALVTALTKGLDHSTPKISFPMFSPFDSTSELWTDYWARFQTFVAANAIPGNRVAQIFVTNQTKVTYKLLSNMASQQSPAKDINELSIDDRRSHM
ncbi:hypothetical protein EMCRGX_G030194 [Ephydatia muelleri]